MKTAITTATVVLLGASAMLLHAQGIPDTGNSRLWEMRKKVQQRSTQRTGSYLDQLNESLSVGDPSRAEAALKSAIAQGTLSQSQIEDARGRIQVAEAQKRATLVAEARARDESAAKNTGGSRASSSPPSMAVQSGAASCGIRVQGGSWFNAVRIFNVNASGQETTAQSAASPGNCSYASKSESSDDWTSYHDVNLFAGDNGLAGTYGYELKYVEVVARKLIKDNDTGHRKTFTGTFTIPAGATQGTLTVERFDWNASTVQLRPYWD